MKVEILRDNLKSGLGAVEKIVGKNISLPILDNVLMGSEDSFLSLISTNLETTIARLNASNSSLQSLLLSSFSR